MYVTYIFQTAYDLCRSILSACNKITFASIFDEKTGLNINYTSPALAFPLPQSLVQVVPGTNIGLCMNCDIFDHTIL
jgi:hypothetical protein